jgi:hypothetical protein
VTVDIHLFWIAFWVDEICSAGAFYIFYLQHNVNKPVRSFSKVTSGRGGFATRLQVDRHTSRADPIEPTEAQAKISVIW